MTINWLPPPAEQEQLPYLPLRRVPAAGSIMAYITCERLQGVQTHYYEGRTIPCTHPDCQGCAAGRPQRYEAYITTWNETAQLHSIYAITETAARTIQGYLTEGVELRGLFIQISRAGKRPNGRLLIQLTTPTAIPRNLPPAPPVAKLLEKIWRIEPHNHNGNHQGDQ